MMARIGRGECLPDYLMRNRIMARLGIAAEGYEDFLQPLEYDRYLKRADIMEEVENKNISSALALIENLFESALEDNNKIELQFLYDMQARCFIYNNRPAEEIRNIYKKAYEIKENYTML